LGTFWLKIEQFWPFDEISIFSNSGHLEWRAGLSDTILKGTHPAWHHFSSVVRPSTFHILIFSSETTGPIATKLWWNGPFKIVSVDLFYQNMPNLHNQYISAERKISQKNQE
jgi:hypothetical protein